MDGPGRLVVVAPPAAGPDGSARAVEVVGTADVMAREGDGALDADALVAAVAGGATVALVTAGGTGASAAVAGVVAAVVDAGLVVEVAPAPVPAVAALVGSGLPTDRIAVDPALPPSGPERRARVDALAGERRTTALPVTVADVSAIAAACGPDRPMAVDADGVVRRGTAADAVAWAGAAPGPVILVVAGRGDPEEPEPATDDAVLDALRAARERGLSPGRAAAEVAAATGRTRREVYALGAAAEDGP